jgi:hypothetical protein
MAITVAALVARFVWSTKLSAATLVERRSNTEALNAPQDRMTLVFDSGTEDASLHSTEVSEIQDEDEQAVCAVLTDGVLWEQFKLAPKIDKTEEPAIEWERAQGGRRTELKLSSKQQYHAMGIGHLSPVDF